MTLTIKQIKQRGFLKVSDKIPLKRNQLAEDLFNADTNDKEYEEFSFFIKKKIKGKEVKRRVWSVRFGSKKIERFNHLSDNGMEIRETLKKRFPMKKGELRAAFRYKDENSWEFLGVFKFIRKDKPKNDEKSDMPSGCYTNCYERISDGLILEDWQYEKN